MGIIYRAVSVTSKKSYIGLTRTTLAKRWKRHCNNSKYKGPKFHFNKAIAKYGQEDFIVYELEECDDSVLSSREIYYISLYDTYNNGYNSTTGGEDSRGRPGRKLSEVTKHKLRLAALQQHKDNPLHAINSSRLNRDKVVCKDSAGVTKVVPKATFDADNTLVGVSSGLTQTAESNNRRSKSLTGRALTSMHKESLSKAARRTRGRFLVFDHTGTQVYSNLSAKEVQSICRSLYGKTKENKLGASVQAKQQLNHQCNLHYINWFTEKVTQQ